MSSTISYNPVLYSILKQYFEFDEIFNLYKYGVGLDGLYNELKTLCKSEYNNNYRFIFLHYDTDYHITNDQPGLVLRNLQRIIKELDISNYFCMVVSQKDLQKDLDTLREQETLDDCSIYCLQHPLEDFSHFDYFDVNLNADQIKHNFVCLNRIKRKHRTILYALLKDRNLVDKGIITFGSRL